MVIKSQPSNIEFNKFCFLINSCNITPCILTVKFSVSKDYEEKPKTWSRLDIFDNDTNFSFSNYFYDNNFFYKKRRNLIRILEYSSNQRKKTFFNFGSRRLATYRSSRHIHWRFFTHKTLREYRYKLFLKTQLKKQSACVDRNPYYFFLINLKLLLPWQLWSKILKQFYLVLKYKNLKQFQIYQLPLDFIIFNKLTIQRRKQRKFLRYAARWSWGYKARRNRFWLKPRLKLPKVFKQLLPKRKPLGCIVQFDFLTLSFVILRTQVTSLRYLGIWNITQNKLLKLLNFRYRA